MGRALGNVAVFHDAIERQGRLTIPTQRLTSSIDGGIGVGGAHFGIVYLQVALGRADPSVAIRRRAKWLLLLVVLILESGVAGRV